ncbi:MAG: hypothetical protein MJZ34_00120 [Paludibacteraceae bacterium]|nr:hypothetical protein [Paludibacteraceae bacterium]
MEQDYFFQLAKGEGTEYNILLNKNHELFKDHFPEFPILPGSCSTEIIRTAVEKETKKKCRLRKIKSLKFIQPIIPNEVKGLQLSLAMTSEDDSRLIHVKTAIKSEEFIHAKADLIFEQDND